MAPDGPRSQEGRVSAPRESLKPVAAARAPLSAGFHALPGGPVGSQVARLKDELATVRRALRAQRAESRVEKQNNERLTLELAALRRELEKSREGEPLRGSAQLDVESLETRHRLEVDRLRAAYDARVRELETKCARDIAHLEEKHAAKQSALRNSLSAAEELSLAKSERIRGLLARLNRVHAEGAELQSIPPRPGALEDLTVLHGIGPVYALALRRVGVHTLTQIAQLTPEDIRTIAPKIGTTAARIFRERWVEEAQKLIR